MTRLASLALFALVACGPGEVGDPEIVSWTVDPLEIVAGGDATSTVELAHFELSGEGHHMGDTGMTGMSTEAEAGHEHGDGDVPVGHVHIYLDDLETNPLLMQTTDSDTFTIPMDTAPGKHTLIARLQDENHKILEPQVTAEIEITVLDMTGM